MFRKRSLGLAFFLFTSIGVLRPDSVHATAIANSQISFFNLQIIPTSGTVVFLDPWTAEAFAQAQNSLGQFAQQFNSSVGGVAQADALVTFAQGHGIASAVNLTAGADSHGNIPGTTTAQARSTGIGDFFNSFTIVRGEWTS